MNTESADSFLRLQSIDKSFGAVHVVKSLSLSIRKGEFISILGPSGCGKTTLLRIVAGFFDANGGEIWLDGERIDQVPSHKRGAAMVFQNYALFPHMTVFENVAFGLKMRKVPRKEIEKRVGEALALVQLGSLDKRYPKELSGGQQQRVALARAVVLSPKLLLLDEPLSNLDAKLRKELRSQFLDIHRAAEITTLFVTHDLEEAFSVSDRVAVMNHGRIEQFGTPAEIFTKPQTHFVADFVGHSNILEGEILSDGVVSAIEKNGLRIKTPKSEAPGGAVRLALPDHLLRLSASSIDIENCYPAKLRSVSYLGASIQFEVELNGFRLTGQIPAPTDLVSYRAGQNVFVGWRAEDMVALPSKGN